MQITQTGSVLNLAANNLAKDLSGDGIEDLPLIATSNTSTPGSYRVVAYSSGTSFGSVYFASTTFTSFFVAKVGSEKENGSSPVSATNFVPIQFSDARINSGAETSGLLEITAANHDFNDHSITFVRLVFDDASTDEPGDAVAGGTNPEWTRTVEIGDTVENVARKAMLKKKIKRLKPKIREARRKGKRFTLRNLKRKYRQARRELRNL